MLQIVDENYFIIIIFNHHNVFTFQMIKLLCGKCSSFIRLDKFTDMMVFAPAGGKSAIVTALVVGLGGKASTTSRGSAIKNFVKVGKR